MGGRAVRSAVRAPEYFWLGQRACVRPSTCGAEPDPFPASRSATSSGRGTRRQEPRCAHYHILPVQDMHQYTSTIVTKQRKPKPYQTSPYQHDSNETTKTKIVTKRRKP